MKKYIPIALSFLLMGCNLFRDEFSRDLTGDYPEIVNADYELAQDCIVFKCFDSDSEPYYICTENNWNMTEQNRGEVKIIKRISKGAKCRIIEINSIRWRSGHLWITYYMMVLKIECYSVIPDPRSLNAKEFLDTNKETRKLRWDDFLIESEGTKK